MSGTYTTSDTFTRVHASHLASKVAADLLQMQHFYGYPSHAQINNYIEELIILMLGGYLDSVDYGYKRDGNWVIVVSYSAKFGILSSSDDRSGGVYPGADIKGTHWSSYLRKTPKFWSLSQAERERIENSLPFQRNGTAEPGYHEGKWVTDKNYYNGGVGLQRKIFQPY